MILSGGQALDFAPQALAETVPLASSTGYFYADQGIELSGKFATYGQMYRSQPAVATLVDKVANAEARLTLNVWDDTGKGKTLDTTSPFAKLLANPTTVMDTKSFYRWTRSTYEIYGEAFWLKIRNGSGRVISLLPMHPSRTAVVREKGVDGVWRTFYVFTIGVASAGLLKAPQEDVVPFLRYDPDNIMRGLSRLEPLRSTLLNEDAARRANASFWKRGARPSLMISAPAALSDKAYQRLAAQVGKVHGGVDQAGGTLVLEEGAKPVPVQLTAEEMQYIEGRKLDMQECCMVYDVPPPVVHILDHATFSNITEQMRSMYRDTMAPRLEDDESVIDFYLRPDFAPDGSKKAKFALDEVLRGDFETRATAVVQLIANGVMKPSEARPLFDLDDAGAVADKLYANAALQELGKPAERVTVTAAGTATEGEQDAIDDTVDGAAAADKPATNNGGQQLRQRTQQPAAPVRRGGRPPKKQED